MRKLWLTRKERAEALLEHVKLGPAHGSLDHLSGLTEADRYRLWADTWIVPELIALIPELRKRHPFTATEKAD